MPASPAKVSARAPQASPSRVISASPRVMSADFALSPKPKPSTPPAARAITFFAAAQSSTPTTSLFTYTRKRVELTACWSSTASALSSDAITAAAGRPWAISSACVGPERTATGRPWTTCERRSPDPGSRPFVRLSSGTVPGSSCDERPERPARDGEAHEVDAVERRVGQRGRADPGEVAVPDVAGVPARLGDDAGLLGIAARERDVVPPLREERGEDRAPRAAADDRDHHRHDRRTKSITTGTPASPNCSRSLFSTQ